MAVGYEVSYRISLAPGVNSWHRGFYNTSVAGGFGAVAVFSRLRGLTTQQNENAFGPAGSFASGSMRYLQNGSWNKHLHPAKAAHDALIIVAMAQARVLGATKPIEGEIGFIAAHTDAPRMQVSIHDLSDYWEFVNTGLKAYPACRVTHTPIGLAALLSKDHTVKSIHILMNPACVPVVGLAKPNKVHPLDVVDAQFLAYYQTASWLYGENQGLSIDHLKNFAVQALCGKITIEAK